ncbi:MAG: hypothetical protein WAM60_22520 [Candidatus Promineifilaceae bacterium]
MSGSPGIVLHQYRVTFLWIVVPIFFVLGCLILAMAIGLPILIKPTGSGTFISIAIAAVAGAALPIIAILLVVFIPSIVTIMHPDRGVLELVYKRPLWTSRKEFPFTDIAKIQPLYTGDDDYSLALMLKSGQTTRIDYSSTSDREALEKTAAQIMVQLAPYLL